MQIWSNLKHGDFFTLHYNSETATSSTMNLHLSNAAAKILALLNHLEVPQVMSCRASAIQCTTQEYATFWKSTPLSPSSLLANTTPTPYAILKKAGHLLWLWDERLPEGKGLQTALEKRLQNLLEQANVPEAPSRRETLRRLADDVHEWSQNQNWSAENEDYFNGAILLIQPEGSSVLTFGKATVRTDANRLRARNFLSIDALQGFLQDRIKYRLQTSTRTTTALIEDWSWQTGEERFVCRFEEIELQGASRSAILASDVWLPTDTEVLCQASLDSHGGASSAALAMSKAFGRIGERPRGACAVVDVLPQGMDTPDADDALDAVNKAAKVLKGVKGASGLGVGLGKLAAGAVLVGVVVYGVWQWLNNDAATPTSPQGITERTGTRSNDTRREKMRLQDSTDKESILAETGDTLQAINSAIEKTVIAFEKMPRTVVPVLLNTNAPITSSNLASRVKVEISGAQTITKYHVELDTAKRTLPPKTTRLNVIIEEPLNTGKYRLKLTYKAEETTSATVDIKAVSKDVFKNISLDSILSAQPDVSSTSGTVKKRMPSVFHKTFRFGKQVTVANRQLELWRGYIEEQLGANLSGLTDRMFLAYRFYYFNGDTSQTYTFQFDENRKRGLQRGQSIPARVQQVELWIQFKGENGLETSFAKAGYMVRQESPTISAENPKIHWIYQDRIGTKNKKGYLPKNIEVSITGGVSIAYDDVPIDVDSLSGETVFASLKDVKIPEKPSIENPVQDEETLSNSARLTISKGLLKVYDASGDKVFPQDVKDYIQVMPLSTKFEKGQYSCKFLISNLPPKPKNETWKLVGVLTINPKARILNPINKNSSFEEFDTEFQLPINIEYQ